MDFMKDIKLFEKCEKCGENLTLMESQRHPEGTLWAVKRCLSCGGHPVEEVTRLYLEKNEEDENDDVCIECSFCVEDDCDNPKSKRYGENVYGIVVNCSFFNSRD